jgi:hypothetical protein
MAFLPQGWGTDVANAEAFVGRERLKDGEYVLLHKGVQAISTKKGDAIVIEHEIISAKKIAADVDPNVVGSTWGYFLPKYGDAAMMCLPNVKSYILGLLGYGPKTNVSKDELAKTIDEFGGPKQMARGMLIRGVTFHTTKKDGDDFTGMNWHAVEGENVPTAPGVLKRRQELDAKEGAGAPVAVAAPSLPGAPPLAAPSVPGVDPFAGWTVHPQNAEWYYRHANGKAETKSKADLVAGR